MTKFTALIPTSANALYSTFGIDIVTSIDPANDDFDTQPVVWIEGGEFPTEDGFETWADFRVAASELAAASGWSIDLDGPSEDAGEYRTFNAEER